MVNKGSYSRSCNRTEEKRGVPQEFLACLGAVRLGHRADEDVLCAVDLPGDDGGAEGVDGALGAGTLAVLQDDHFGHVVGVVAEEVRGLQSLRG